eukprot:scaffold88149_cov54-Phaeocystis_antarctica.AAC.5
MRWWLRVRGALGRSERAEDEKAEREVGGGVPDGRHALLLQRRYALRRKPKLGGLCARRPGARHRARRGGRRRHRKPDPTARVILEATGPQAAQRHGVGGTALLQVELGLQQRGHTQLRHHACLALRTVPPP